MLVENVEGEENGVAGGGNLDKTLEELNPDEFEPVQSQKSRGSIANSQAFLSTGKHGSQKGGNAAKI